MQIRYNLFSKKILYAPVINTRTQSPTHPRTNMQTRQRIRNGRRPSPSTFAVHLDTQAPAHQDRSPAPCPHISSPTVPRADRRPRSVAAGFPRERHFSRAVHRLKISELIWFSYSVNIVAKNI